MGDERPRLPITVSFVVTADDALYLWQVPDGFLGDVDAADRFNLKAAVALLSLLTAPLVLLRVLSGREIFTGPTLLALIGLLVVVPLTLFVARRRRALVAANSMLGQRLTYVVTADGVALSSGRSVRWSDMRSVHDGANAFLIGLDDGSAVVVPHRALVFDFERDVVLGHLRTHTAHLGPLRSQSAEGRAAS